MKLEKQTIELTVRQIVRKNTMGTVLYDLYVSVPCIHPKNMKIKQSNIKTPLVCVTKNHFVPTNNGYVSIENIKIGDVILFGADLMCNK